MKQKIRRTLVICFLLISVLLMLSCGHSNSDQAETSSAGNRSFYLASVPVQFEVTDSDIRIVFDFDGFAGKVDLISLHTDNFFGLPWDEFAGGALVQAWHTVMNQIKTEVEALNVGVYLSLTPLSSMRNGIAAKALDQGGNLLIDNQWCPDCYNFDTDADNIRAAYLAYVRWMVDFFDPIFLTHGIEVDMYMDACPYEYNSLINLLNEVYDQEKAINPDLPIFPSFTAGGLWDYGDSGQCEVGDTTCLVANLALQDSIKRDRFGVSAYPIFMQWEWEGIPQDYFSALSELSGEMVVFCETGWGSYPVTVPWPGPDDECFQVLTSSDDDQIEYMQFLFSQADELGSDLVVWWSLRDYLFEQFLTSCPCDSPGLWCLLYDAVNEDGLLPAFLMWGSMGVMDYNGQEKASYALWHEWRNRTIQ